MWCAGRAPRETAGGIEKQGRNGLKQVAFHKVYWPTGDVTRMTVVVLAEDGRYQSHYTLSGERASVVWKGGVGMLLPTATVPQARDSIAALCQKAQADGGACGLYLWSACGLPCDADVVTPVSAWQPVV